MFLSAHVAGSLGKDDRWNPLSLDNAVVEGEETGSPAVYEIVYDVGYGRPPIRSTLYPDAVASRELAESNYSRTWPPIITTASGRCPHEALLPLIRSLHAGRSGPD